VERKLGTAELIIVIAGAVTLIGSFLPWAEYAGFSQNAWGDSFPLLTWVGIFGTLMAAEILLKTFATVKLPEQIAGFGWKDLHVILGFFTVLIAVSWLIVGDNRGIGYWLSLFGSIGLLVGAWMQRSQPASTI
jgi:hypothetical protein